jgi:hypothetical protein
MTQPSTEDNRLPPEKQLLAFHFTKKVWRFSKGAAAPEQRRLSYQERYSCPICRHGQISAITLMDAFACSFCRHIFAADLRTQSIRVEDSSQPVTWRWNGFSWKSAHTIQPDLTVTVWFAACLLFVFPPLLIGVSSQMFPPLEGAGESWFPLLWMTLTFSLHFLMVAWLLLEHYQTQFYVASKIRLQDLLGRR